MFFVLLQKSFQTGTNARLDERTFAMCQVKTQPLVHLMLTTHPSLYRVDNLSDEVRSAPVLWVLLDIVKLNYIHYGNENLLLNSLFVFSR